MIVALGIALMVHFLDITNLMGLVSATWSIFGATFGPVIILSLFWKRFNYKGAVASLCTEKPSEEVVQLFESVNEVVD